MRLGGVPLAELEAQNLRQPFGLVLQEDFLFSGSVRDNLVMGREGIGEDELAQALVASGAGPFVGGLEGGLDAPVAERGATFSTGERQLLAIARALAGRPDIIILDEATARVDSATERRMERGRIVERGTHGDLLQAGKQYARLYHLQFEGQKEPGTGPR